MLGASSCAWHLSSNQRLRYFALQNLCRWLVSNLGQRKKRQAYGLTLFSWLRGLDSALCAFSLTHARSELLRVGSLHRTSDLRPALPCWSLVQSQSQSQIKTALFRTVFIWLRGLDSNQRPSGYTLSNTFVSVWTISSSNFLEAGRY